MALQNEDFSDVMNQVNQMRASGRTLGPNTVRDLLAAKMKAAQAERLAQRQSDIQAESVQNTKDYQTGSLALGNTAEADKISEGALNRTAAADLADKSRSSAAWTGAGSLAASLAMMDAQGGWKASKAIGDLVGKGIDKMSGSNSPTDPNSIGGSAAKSPSMSDAFSKDYTPSAVNPDLQFNPDAFNYTPVPPAFDVNSLFATPATPINYTPVTPNVPDTDFFTMGQNQGWW
jgi:hypothetical protein